LMGKENFSLALSLLVIDRNLTAGWRQPRKNQ